MSQRFAAPLQHSARWIANDCKRVARLAAQGYPYLRFEDGFLTIRPLVDRLATLLGIGCEPAVRDGIFGRYRTEAVRCFARSLEALPPERLTTVGPYRMDRITQVLAPHIGDGRSGKWRDLPLPVQAELTRWFQPFPGPLWLRGNDPAKPLKVWRQGPSPKRNSSSPLRVALRRREKMCCHPGHGCRRMRFGFPIRPGFGVASGFASDLRERRNSVKNQHLVAPQVAFTY